MKAILIAAAVASISASDVPNMNPYQRDHARYACEDGRLTGNGCAELEKPENRFDVNKMRAEDAQHQADLKSRAPKSH